MEAITQKTNSILLKGKKSEVSEMLKQLIKTHGADAKVVDVVKVMA